MNAIPLLIFLHAPLPATACGNAMSPDTLPPEKSPEEIENELQIASEQADKNRDAVQGTLFAIGGAALGGGLVFIGLAAVQQRRRARLWERVDVGA